MHVIFNLQHLCNFSLELDLVGSMVKTFELNVIAGSVCVLYSKPILYRKIQ